MPSLPNGLIITADRDSVCMGDDVDSHEAIFSAPLLADVSELIRLAKVACPLASIDGGMATWIVEVRLDANDDFGCPVAVVAQQWPEARLLGPPTSTVESIFESNEGRMLYFKYWCQADPNAVFNALENMSPLPERYPMELASLSVNAQTVHKPKFSHRLAWMRSVLAKWLKT